MIINPKTAIANGWISGLTNPEKQIQPNAIDFPIDRLFSIDSSKPFIISEERKSMRGGVECIPRVYKNREHLLSDDEQKYWIIHPNSVYDAMSNIQLKLPEGVAAEIIIRSTFNRNGIFITSGLWDSGYEGAIGMAIHNRSGEAYIAPGTRIGQIKFIQSESSGAMYAGGYNHEAGTHWSEST